MKYARFYISKYSQNYATGVILGENGGGLADFSKNVQSTDNRIQKLQNVCNNL
jgi:hypothetical protein